MYYVYEIKFPEGMIYVGYTNDPERRFNNHKKRIVNRLVNEQVQIHGWNNAIFRIKAGFQNESDAHEVEKNLISDYSIAGKSLNYVHNDSCSYSNYNELDNIDRDTEQLIVEINEQLRDNFKEKVKSEGRSMKWYINRWVKEYTYNKKEVK